MVIVVMAGAVGLVGAVVAVLPRVAERAAPHAPRALVTLELVARTRARRLARLLHDIDTLLTQTGQQKYYKNKQRCI